MDSSTLLLHVKHELAVPEIHALTFIYGQKHSKEIEMAKWQAEQAAVASHNIIDLSSFKQLTPGGSALTDESIIIPDLDQLTAEELKQPPTYVPNRNMILLSLAAAHAEAIGSQDVFYGAQAQDEYGYWDCTVDFIESINRLLSLNRKKPVRIHAPFVNCSKAEVLTRGLALGVDFDHTWTCYKGKDKPCGTCPSCVERNRAFSEVEKRNKN